MPDTNSETSRRLQEIEDHDNKIESLTRRFNNTGTVPAAQVFHPEYDAMMTASQRKALIDDYHAGAVRHGNEINTKKALDEQDYINKQNSGK